MACRLIESVMMNLTIPEIYVRRTFVNYTEHDDMVDGKQRCTTLLNFSMNNRPTFWKGGAGFRLADCKRMPCLNGLCYSDFTKKMLTQFHGYMLGVVAAKGADDQAVGELFQHLNENTVRLTDQEIRAAVHRGPFNKLAKELAMLPAFREFVSESLDLHMESTQLVERFLAFCRNGTKGYATAVENSMEAKNEMEFCHGDRYTDTADHLMKRAFLNAVTLSSAVFGKPGAKARISNVLFELVLCGFANRDQASVLRHATEIRAALLGLYGFPPFSWARYDLSYVPHCFRNWERTLDRILGASIPAGAEGPQQVTPTPVAKKRWTITVLAPPADVERASAAEPELAEVKEPELLTRLA